MKIVTVNVPESFIGSIAKLVGDNGLYPSRSELIRVAVREFLIKELTMAENMSKMKIREPTEKEKYEDDDSIVRVPIERLNEKNEPIKEYKTYRIIRRLEN